MQRKLNWYGDLFTNGETSKAKTPLGEFKVTTPENPLLSKQAVTSKRILVPYTNLQLNPILVPYTNLQLNPYPNTQLDWFCSDNLSFQCKTWLTNQCMDPNTWLTYQLEKNVSCKVLHFICMMKIKNLLGYKTLQYTNTSASLRERWTRANCLRSQYACNNKCNSLITTLKIILIYV